MNENDVENFIKEVDIDDVVDESKELCADHEYWEKAMNSYLQYPCYENGWTIQKKKKGAYELTNKNNPSTILLADIITSMKTPVNKYLRKNNKKTFKGSCFGKPDRTQIGGDIRNFLKAGKYDKDDELEPFLKAFAIVYYWYGNMMPVNRNAQGAENWNARFQTIKECFHNEHSNKKQNGSYKIDWQNWIKEEWLSKSKTIEQFIEENFCQDVIESYNPLVLKLKKLPDWGKENEVGNWFLNNTKIIIQRSYRIYCYGIAKDDEEKKVLLSGDCFTKSSENNIHQDNIKKILKKVFEDAGFDLENANDDEKNAFLKIF